MANTTGDPYVLNVQKWLNATYGNDSRYNIIPENGKTGWTTIYALTRALQIRLGIQATADNFGPSTQSLFNSTFKGGVKQQASNDETEDNIYAIIQGALLCKGYATGVNTPTLHFYEGTGNAIKALKKDAGLSDTSSTVTLNIMKALLSMDYFYSYDTSIKTKNIQTIQRYLNRNYEDYIGIKPCDGIYGRETNKALIYAFQAEEGMPTNVANGNLGPSTRRCCPTLPYNNVETNYNGNKYTTINIKNFIKLMKMGLYVNGIGNGDFSDSMDSNLVKEFQTKFALNKTGICDLPTWLSIFISCGDTERSAIACDCATILTPAKAKTLYDSGYRYVGRYLSGTIVGGASKALSVEELKTAFNAGLRIFPIQQGNARYIEYFTIEQARSDADNALKYGRLLGIPKGTIIYFAVDCDPQDYEITNYIIPYFQEIFTLLKTYRIGIYGTRNVCSRVCNAGYAVSSFVADMSSGWSGNLGFGIPDNWAFDQFTTVTIGSGEGQIEIDKDGFSGKDTGIGSIENQVSRVASMLEQIHDLAMTYTNNNQTKSSLLVLQYLRKRGGYGDSLFNSGSTLLWSTVAGSIDDNFCQLVENNLGVLDFSFFDPVTNNKHDIFHLAATANALLYKLSDDRLDTLTDLYAGWGGDMLSFAKDIHKAETDGNTDIIQWAKDNICTDTSSNFEFNDYLADIDAINIVNNMNETGLPFYLAFASYFSDPLTGVFDAQKRTTKYMNSIGTNYIEDTCTLLNQDELGIFKFILSEFEFKQKYFDAAITAFKAFIYNQYVNGR